MSDAELLERMARALNGDGRHVPLRRFQARERYHVRDGAAARQAVFVRVETTGPDPTRDRIVALGAVPFEYGVFDGRIYDVGEAVHGVEDPGHAIPAEVGERTGITDDQVRGARIDDRAVNALLARVSLVIAHEASVDRAFLERRLPRFARVAWACSMRGIPWARHGCESARLDYLLMRRCAEFFDAGGVVEQCRAGIHLLATPLSNGELPMKLLLAAVSGQPIAAR